VKSTTAYDISRSLAVGLGLPRHDMNHVTLQWFVLRFGCAWFATWALALVFVSLYDEQSNVAKRDHDSSIFQTPLGIFATLTVFYIAISINLAAILTSAFATQCFHRLNPAILLNLLCCVTYFLMYMDWMPVYSSPRGETIYPLQFVEWSVSAPILCWVHFSRSNFKTSAYVATLAASQGMVVSLVLASYTEGPLYVLAVVATCVFATVVIYKCDKFLAVSVKTKHPKSSFPLQARVLSVSSWLLFVLLFVLQRSSVLAFSSNTFWLLYSFAQVVHKSLVVFFLELQLFVFDHHHLPLSMPRGGKLEEENNGNCGFLHYSDVFQFQNPEKKPLGKKPQPMIGSSTLHEASEAHSKWYEQNCKANERVLTEANNRSHQVRKDLLYAAVSQNGTRYHVDGNGSGSDRDRSSFGQFLVNANSGGSLNHLGGSGSNCNNYSSNRDSGDSSGSGSGGNDSNNSNNHNNNSSGGSGSNRNSYKNNSKSANKSANNLKKSKNNPKNKDKGWRRESSNSDGSVGSRTSGFSGDSVDGSGRDFPTSEEASNSPGGSTDSRNHSDSPPPFPHFCSSNGSTSDSTSSSDASFYGEMFLRNRKNQRTLNQEYQRKSSDDQDALPLFSSRPPKESAPGEYTSALQATMHAKDAKLKLDKCATIAKSMAIIDQIVEGMADEKHAN